VCRSLYVLMGHWHRAANLARALHFCSAGYLLMPPSSLSAFLLSSLLRPPFSPRACPSLSLSFLSYVSVVVAYVNREFDVDKCTDAGDISDINMASLNDTRSLQLLTSARDFVCYSSRFGVNRCETLIRTNERFLFLLRNIRTFASD